MDKREKRKTTATKKLFFFFVLKKEKKKKKGGLSLLTFILTATFIIARWPYILTSGIMSWYIVICVAICPYFTSVVTERVHKECTYSTSTFNLDQFCAN